MADYVPIKTELLVAEELKEITDWNELGARLGVPRRILREIEQHYGHVHGPGRCRYEMINRWWRTCPTANWGDIVAALREMDENRLARYLVEKYQRSLHLDFPASCQSAIVTDLNQLSCGGHALSHGPIRIFVSADVPKQLCQLMNGYADMLLLLRKSCLSSETLQDVKFYLYDLCDDDDSFLRCSSIVAIVEQRKRYISMFNIETLIISLNVFKLSLRVKKSVRKYKKQLDVFLSDTSVQQLKDAFEQQTPLKSDFETITLKLDKKEPLKLLALKKLAYHIFGISSKTMILFDFRSGCITVTWLAPNAVVPILKKNAWQHSPAALEMLGVLEVVIGAQVVHQASTNLHEFPMAYKGSFNIHSIYHESFLVLSMGVKVNEHELKIESESHTSQPPGPVLRYKDITFTPEFLKESLAALCPILGVHNVARVRQGVLFLFELDFAGEVEFERFCKSMTTLQMQLKDKITQELSGGEEVELAVKLHLIKPNADKKEPQITEVTSTNYQECFTLLRESALFEFGALKLMPSVEEKAKRELTIDDLGELLQEMIEVAAYWFTVGTCLEVPYHMLESIKEDHRDQCVNCLRAMLAAWLRGTEATLGRLVHAVRFAGMIALARKIAAKHGITAPITVDSATTAVSRDTPQMAAQRVEIASRDVEYDVLTQTSENLRQELEETDKMIKEAISSLSMVKDQIDSLNNERENLTKKRERKESHKEWLMKQKSSKVGEDLVQLNQIIEDTEEAITKLSVKIIALEKEINARKEAAERMEAQLQEHQKEEEQLKGEMAKYREEMQSLKNRLEEERKKMEMTMQMQRMEHKHAQEKDLLKHGKEMDSMKHNLEMGQKEMEKILLEKEMERMKLEIEIERVRHEKELERKRQKEDLEKTSNELNPAKNEKEIERLKYEKETLEKQIEKMKNEIEKMKCEHEEERTKLMKEMETMKDKEEVRVRQLQTEMEVETQRGLERNRRMFEEELARVRRATWPWWFGLPPPRPPE